jgi:hypothetical protein
VRWRGIFGCVRSASRCVCRRLSPALAVAVCAPLGLRLVRLMLDLPCRRPPTLLMPMGGITGGGWGAHIDRQLQQPQIRQPRAALPEYAVHWHTNQKWSPAPEIKHQPGYVWARQPPPTSPDTRKRPKELMGTSVRRVLRLRINPQSLVAAWFLARLPCGRRTWFQGPSRGSLLEPVWRFNLPLRARRNVRWGPWSPQQACPRTCKQSAESYPRTCGHCGRSVDTLAWEVDHGPIHGQIHRPTHRRTGWMGDASWRFQPPLAERPLPPHPTAQGSPQRSLARAPAPR